jgi:GT2 family glycosyltransferase
MIELSEVAIIILTCNQKEFTFACVSSIFESVGREACIILVDNASTDGTKEAIKETFPTVLYIRCEKNNGVAGGRNIGAIEAERREFQYVFFIDNDTLFFDNSMVELIAFMEENYTYAGVNPLVVYNKEPSIICHSIGRYYSWIFHNKSIDTFDREKEYLDEVIDVDWIPGCAGLFRTRAIKDIGYFDEIYNPYGPEDVDLSLRLKNRKMKLGFVSSAKIIHNQDPYRIPSRENVKNIARGKVLFIKKHAKNILHLCFGITWLLIKYLYIGIVSRKGKGKYFMAVLNGVKNGFRS